MKRRRNDKNKNEYFKRMDQSGNYYPFMFMAMTPAVIAQAFNVNLPAFLTDEINHAADRRSDRNGRDNLHHDYLDDYRSGNPG